MISRSLPAIVTVGIGIALVAGCDRNRNTSNRIFDDVLIEDYGRYWLSSGKQLTVTKVNGLVDYRLIDSSGAEVVTRLDGGVQRKVKFRSRRTCTD